MALGGLRPLEFPRAPRSDVLGALSAHRQSSTRRALPRRRRTTEKPRFRVPPSLRRGTSAVRISREDGSTLANPARRISQGAAKAPVRVDPRVPWRCELFGSNLGGRPGGDRRGDRDFVNSAPFAPVEQRGQLLHDCWCPACRKLPSGGSSLSLARD